MGALEENPELDSSWMRHALELARRGIGLCSPNPVVGCVIVDRNGELAGEGWHEYELKDHAEVVALRAAGEKARGGAAYVTLEPCNHTGRTGPCTEALIKAGVARVVAATVDPNPLVAGGGIAGLRAAGIETRVGVGEEEARRLNEGFACWIQHKRPFVLMKVAMTLDGRIAPPAGVHTAREPYWITGEESRAAVQTLRWRADAVLTGIGTVLADDPLLTDRSGMLRRRPLLRVVLDSALRIPLDSKLVKSAREDVLVCTVSNDGARIEEIRARGVRVEILEAENGQVPLVKVLGLLGSEGVLTLLTETGSRLNTALLGAGLVDRLQLFVSSQMMGADAVSAFGGMGRFAKLGPVEVERLGEDLGIGSLLRDPWPIP